MSTPAPSMFLGIPLLFYVIAGAILGIVLVAAFLHAQNAHLWAKKGAMGRALATAGLLIYAIVYVLGPVSSALGLSDVLQHILQPAPSKSDGKTFEDKKNTADTHGDGTVSTATASTPIVNTENCSQYVLVDKETGRLNTGELEACVSQISDCTVFTAHLCYKYPMAAGYDTCISYIWKHMTTDDRAAFRTAIATQPLCKDIFHSILN